MFNHRCSIYIYIGYSKKTFNKYNVFFKWHLSKLIQFYLSSLLMSILNSQNKNLVHCTSDCPESKLGYQCTRDCGQCPDNSICDKDFGCGRISIIYIEEVIKECCKQCRHVKFKGTPTKWPVQKQTSRRNTILIFNTCDSCTQTVYIHTVTI